MTNEEKANFTTGMGLATRCSGNTGAIERLGIPSLCFQDGPAGPRGIDGVSAFAAEVNAASTWDTDLIYAQSLAMGNEFKTKGTNVVFAPVTGGPLGRSPYMGRNWEGFGSDQYLHGISGYWAVKGIQDAGVMATPKHLVAYEQETYRWTGLLQNIAGQGIKNPANNTNTVQISSNVSNRTLRELYLWPFEEVMEAKPLAIMCSYNRLNGTSTCADGELLTTILKDEWEFPGFVLSDYGSVFMAASTVDTANAGLDMDLPGGEGYWGSQIVDAVNKGNISQSRLDDMVHRILYGYYELNQDKGYPTTSYSILSYGSSLNEHVDAQSNHARIIKTVGEDSAVLLKNTRTFDTGLPLKKGARLAVFGEDAGPRPKGFNLNPTNSYPASSENNGTIALGFGSGAGRFPYLVDPYAAINWAASANRWQVNGVLEDYPSFLGDQTLLQSYDAAISQADTCLVFVSVYSGEGLDRDSLNFDNNGDQLIKYVADQCNNTIVIANIPGPTNFEVAHNHPNVTAILNAGYAGQESGRSLLSILDGSVNPSGKSVYTILQNDQDYIPVFKNVTTDPVSTFTEGLFIDYKAADQNNLPVRYEFGYGLSYTTFNYSNIEVTQRPGISYENASRTDSVLTVTANVINSGSLEGKEVSQLYISFPSGSGEPPNLLRGFKKTPLYPGQTRTLTFDVRKKDIQIWSESLNAWTIPRGQFTVRVGGSSRNLPLSATFTV